MTMTVIILLFIVLVLSALDIIQYVIPLLFFGAFVYLIFKYMGTGNKNGIKSTIANPVPTLPTKQAPAPNSHASQHNYSAAYSQKKTESRGTIKDPPLSEAERNVLYGK